jgi:hypothetical protein
VQQPIRCASTDIIPVQHAVWIIGCRLWPHPEAQRRLTCPPPSSDKHPTDPQPAKICPGRRCVTWPRGAQREHHLCEKLKFPVNSHILPEQDAGERGEAAALRKAHPASQPTAKRASRHLPHHCAGINS